MNEAARLSLFDELPPAEQHTLATYVDEASRRDTLVEAVVVESGGPLGFDDLLHAIPTEELDRRTAVRLHESLEWLE